MIVDDGIATGSTARAACDVARAQGATRVVLAVPVAPPDWTDRLAGARRRVRLRRHPGTLLRRRPVLRRLHPDHRRRGHRLLERAAVPATAAAASGDDPPVRDDEVAVQAGTVLVAGHLTVPEVAAGVVVFAHGSGSSRHSPRNRYVASVLNAAGLATLLFDLLTPREELDRANVFDIELLARRLGDVTRWLRDPARDRQPAGRLLRCQHRRRRRAVGGSRAGRRHRRGRVAAADAPISPGPGSPTSPRRRLLIVGGRDDVVLALNRQAQARLRCDEPAGDRARRHTPVRGAWHPARWPPSWPGTGSGSGSSTSPPPQPHRGLPAGRDHRSRPNDTNREATGRSLPPGCAAAGRGPS